MTSKILAVRINRRAIGAVVLSNDTLTMTDGRHLPSNTTRAARALARWIRHWLTQATDAAVVLDTPALVDGTSMKALVDGLNVVLAEQGIVPLRVGKPEILTAYGLRPVRSRQDVRASVSEFWPQLSTTPGRVAPFVADAAAAALWAECRLAFNPETS